MIAAIRGGPRIRLDDDADPGHLERHVFRWRLQSTLGGRETRLGNRDPLAHSRLPSPFRVQGTPEPRLRTTEAGDRACIRPGVLMNLPSSQWRQAYSAVAEEATFPRVGKGTASSRPACYPPAMRSSSRTHDAERLDDVGREVLLDKRLCILERPLSLERRPPHPRGAPPRPRTPRVRTGIRPG